MRRSDRPLLEDLHFWADLADLRVDSFIFLKDAIISILRAIDYGETKKSNWVNDKLKVRTSRGFSLSMLATRDLLLFYKAKGDY